MKRSEERILTTHVGSLVRPPELLTADDKGDGFEDFLKASVADVVERQAEIGIDIINDGEYGKASWSTYVLDRMTGWERRPDQLRPVEWMGRDLERFPEQIAQEMPQVIQGRPTEACIGPITYTGTDLVRRDVAHLKAALDGVQVEEAFVTAVAPASTAYDGVNEYYDNERDYIYAIADALREEYHAI
ncbi:hypothetical protein [Candidatus Entotheonella palauensis]|nr:hypothetical protein [Candidatus Entotheonella palauensis]